MPKGNTTDALATSAEATPNGLAKADAESFMARINAILEAKPTVEEDPTEAMLELVVNAADPSEWDAIFQAESFKKNDGRQVRIHGYRVQPSDFEGGLSHYMVLDTTDLKSGEKLVLTCSSTMSIAQILNAEARVGLPIDVEIRQKEKPTKAGFRPIHLHYLGKAGAPLGDPSAVVSEQ